MWQGKGKGKEMGWEVGVLRGGRVEVWAQVKVRGEGIGGVVWFVGLVSLVWLVWLANMECCSRWSWMMRWLMFLAWYSLLKVAMKVSMTLDLMVLNLSAVCSVRLVYEEGLDDVDVDV